METIKKPTKIKLNIDGNLNRSLEDTCKLQAQQIEELTAKLNWYEEQFNLSQQKRFGVSSEQTDSDQLSIFNEGEKESRPNKEEPTIEEITYKRKRTKALNKKSFDNLPVEVIEYHLEESDKTCPTCDSPLHEMSKEM